MSDAGLAGNRQRGSRLSDNGSFGPTPGVFAEAGGPTAQRLQYGSQLLPRIARRLGYVLFSVLLWIALPGLALVALATRIRPRRKRLRSLWGTTPILTLVPCARAESLLGIDAETLVHSTYYITSDFTHDLSQLPGGAALRPFLSPLVLAWALLRYDLFHFFFDRGILPSRGRFGIEPLELRLLRLAGKKVFVFSYGADVRTRQRTEALGRYHCCLRCPDVGHACICDEEEGQRNVERTGRLATATFSIGDMTEYIPGSRTRLFFWPLDLDRLPNAPQTRRSDGLIRIAHAPNHRHYKGTDDLLRAVEELKAEGVPLDLVLIERRPNREVLEITAASDIVAEQFLIGAHGYYCLEAMALGKPVISFIRKPAEYLPEPEACPIVSADPDGLKGELRRLAKDASLRRELGIRGRDWVEKHFSLAAFASRLAHVYAEFNVPCGTLNQRAHT